MTQKMKKLIINTALCDITDPRAEVLSAYSAIEINAANIIISPEAKEMLTALPVSMNAASVTQAPQGTQIAVQNGTYEITPQGAPSRPVLLMVNGRLLVRPGSAEALRAYAGIQVNGKVLYPNSLAGEMSRAQVNGSTVAYPDDAVLIDGAARVDALFILRAKETPYFVTRHVVIADEQLDIRALVEKGARFLTKKAFVAERLLADALPLFEDSARILPIPAGSAFVEDEEVLTGALLRRYGPRLFVAGDLVIRAGEEELVAQVERLTVTGTLRVPESKLDSLLAIKPDCGDVAPYKGSLLYDQGHLVVDAALLAQHPHGLTVVDCGSVDVAQDVSPQQILERLVLQGCGAVRCSPAQRGAVMQVASDVGHISDEQKAPDEPKTQEDANHETVNTAYYKL